VEVLKAYSHTPERLDELRKAVETLRRHESDDGRNEAASRRACGISPTDSHPRTYRRSSTCIPQEPPEQKLLSGSVSVCPV
jgi:hypothetical protein